MALGQILALYGPGAGDQPISSASAWAFGSWVWIADATVAFNICGVSFQPTTSPGNDATHDILFEIGLGAVGAEQTVIQIPYSVRSDSSLEYFKNKPIMFPELWGPVRYGTRLSVRVTDSQASAITYDSFKLLVAEIADMATITWNNYVTHFDVGDGEGSTQPVR